MEDYSIVRGQQLRTPCRRRCCMSASLRMFGSLWNAATAHEHRRRDGSRQLGTMAKCQTATGVQVGSAIGIIMPSVRPSVRPSICDSVSCGSQTQGRCTVQDGKLYQHVPSRHVPICRFRHLSCWMYRFAIKRTEKNNASNKTKK